MAKKRTNYSKAVTWLTPREWEKLSTLPQRRKILLHDLVLVFTLYGCALRVSEAVRLKVGDIDFAAQTLTIRDAKRQKVPAVLVPIPSQTLDWLIKWVNSSKRRPGHYVFGKHAAKQSYREWFYFRVRRLARLAGIKKRVTCHTLRRSRATHLLDAGLGIEQVSRLLRHKKITSTMKYLSLSTEMLRKKMKKVDILEN